MKENINGVSNQNIKDFRMIHPTLLPFAIDNPKDKLKDIY